MSAGLMVAAGYLTGLPESQKLALMKICDSADDRTRLAYPGLDAVRIWAGVKRSQGHALFAELQKAGLIMQVEAGYRGHRAVYKVFPAPGDEVMSLAHQRGQKCPGADKFRSEPTTIPQGEEEIGALLAVIDEAPPPSSSRARPGRKKGSGESDPNRKGPVNRTQTEGSGESDPNEATERVQSEPGKGPVEPPIGSGAPDPFRSWSSVPSTSTAAGAPPVDNLAGLLGNGLSSSSDSHIDEPQPDYDGIAADVTEEISPTWKLDRGTKLRVGALLADRLRGGWMPVDLAITLGLRSAPPAGTERPGGLLVARIRDLDPSPPVTSSLPGAQLSSWCGSCDPTTRMLEDGLRLARCTCHPAHGAPVGSEFLRTGASR